MRSQLAIRQGRGGHARAAGLPPMSLVQSAYAVRRPSDQEALSWAFYDSNNYPTGGQTVLTFFQSVGTKTNSDTNMQLNAQLSQGQNFIIQAIEVDFIPGLSPSGTYAAAALPSVTGAATGLASAVNDMYKFYNSGNLVLTVLAKPYITDAPLKKFVPSTVFEVTGGVAGSTTADTNENRTFTSFVRGRRYEISPLLLDSNVSFSVSLNWPEGVVAITTASKVFVRLAGILYRDAQ